MKKNLLNTLLCGFLATSSLFAIDDDLKINTLDSVVDENNQQNYNFLPSPCCELASIGLKSNVGLYGIKDFGSDMIKCNGAPNFENNLVNCVDRGIKRDNNIDINYLVNVIKDVYGASSFNQEKDVVFLLNDEDYQFILENQNLLTTLKGKIMNHEILLDSLELLDVDGINSRCFCKGYEIIAKSRLDAIASSKIRDMHGNLIVVPTKPLDIKEICSNINSKGGLVVHVKGDFSGMKPMMNAYSNVIENNKNTIEKIKNDVSQEKSLFIGFGTGYGHEYIAFDEERSKNRYYLTDSGFNSYGKINEVADKEKADKYLNQAYQNNKVLLYNLLNQNEREELSKDLKGKFKNIYIGFGTVQYLLHGKETDYIKHILSDLLTDDGNLFIFGAKIDEKGLDHEKLFKEVDVDFTVEDAKNDEEVYEDLKDLVQSEIKSGYRRKAQDDVVEYIKVTGKDLEAFNKANIIPSWEREQHKEINWDEYYDFWKVIKITKYSKK